MTIISFKIRRTVIFETTCRIDTKSSEETNTVKQAAISCLNSGLTLCSNDEELVWVEKSRVHELL